MRARVGTGEKKNLSRPGQKRTGGICVQSALLYTSGGSRILWGGGALAPPSKWHCTVNGSRVRILIHTGIKFLDPTHHFLQKIG